MITEDDIRNAQTAWAEAIVDLGRLKGDWAACLQSAEKVLESLYAFDISKVLFKPTKAAQKPFRSSRDGALSYFIGGNDNYPEDAGFALEPWVDIRFENKVIRIDGNTTATVMGHYYFTNDSGKCLKVEYTLGYMTSESSILKIFLHHSSMPFSPSI